MNLRYAKLLDSLVIRLECILFLLLMVVFFLFQGALEFCV